jgi:hypothetical protein
VAPGFHLPRAGVTLKLCARRVHESDSVGEWARFQKVGWLVGLKQGTSNDKVLNNPQRTQRKQR